MWGVIKSDFDFCVYTRSGRDTVRGCGWVSFLKVRNKCAFAMVC